MNKDNGAHSFTEGAEFIPERETYRGWVIEKSHPHPENKYRYFDKNDKNSVLLGNDIMLIKKQIDAFLN